MPLSKPAFVVVDSLAAALSAIDRLIGTADEAELPGLRRASREMSDLLAASPDPRVQWALETLRSARINAGTDRFAAVRELRAHASGLGVLEAGVLVNKVIALGAAKA